MTRNSTESGNKLQEARYGAYAMIRTLDSQSKSRPSYYTCVNSTKSTILLSFLITGISQNYCNGSMRLDIISRIVWVPWKHSPMCLL